MKRYLSATAIAALLASAPAAALSAQDAPPPPATEPAMALLALRNLPAKGDAKLVVLTPAFQAGGDIPFENTQYKGNMFPGLSWSAGPTGTQSYAVIMQDGDALRNGAPILHWTMANIPAGVLKLEAGMSAPPAGAENGPNIRGAAQPFMGPKPPVGPKHRYHFQVFALDMKLPASALADYASMTTAMKDHVLANGEVVGLARAMLAGGF
ncbi:MAG TPA: YbhB/YbcL family Raf kinase inhibitor-like protein [Gemmatimonadaceae bacterium]|jgi:para-nitrobenzyl esterase